MRTSVILALAVAMLLAVRRAAGAFDAPLATGPVAATALALAVWAIALRMAGQRHVAGLAIAVVVLVAFACSFPAGRLIDWLVWAVTVAAIACCPPRGVARISATNCSPPELVVQRLTRSRGADGSETIRGTILAEFAPGERVAILHVAFCPPLEQIPTVTCTAAGGACDVKVAQVLHQGTRLEARLARASTQSAQIACDLVVAATPVDIR